MITTEQRELRRKHLGASDIPAILGMDPYRSPADVFLYKTEQIDDPDETSEAITLGNDFEPVGVKRLAQKLNRLAVADPPTAIAGNGIMLAHADCLLLPEKAKPGTLAAMIGAGAVPGEIKWRSDSSDWGEDGSDQAPVPVIAQVYAQGICLGVSVAYIGAFLPKYRGVDFRHYEIRLDPAYAREIEDRACAWWHRHVVRGVMPDPSERPPALELARRIARKPNVVVPVPAEIVREYVEAKTAATAAAKAKDAAEAKLRAVMAGAEGAEAPGFELEDKEITRKGYVVDPTTYRSLRVKETAPPSAEDIPQ